MPPLDGATSPTSPGSAGPDTARAALGRVRTEIGKVIVGQDATVTGLMLALLCRGHVLLEGVPGVAKTLLVRALAASLSLDMKRMQFTPDLMPSDVTGSLVFDARAAAFEFRQGPVFTNLFLADEINRTPPKTQASLLEVMEERQVSVEGTPRPLPGAVPGRGHPEPDRVRGHLPAAGGATGPVPVQAHRPAADPRRGARRASGAPRRLRPPQPGRRRSGPGRRPPPTSPRPAPGRLRVQVADGVLAYVVDLCRSTRTAPSLELGASPRGATGMLNAAKAFAWLTGRGYVTPDDVKAVARPALRHRVRLRHEAELEGVTADAVLDSLLATVPTPR